MFVKEGMKVAVESVLNKDEFTTRLADRKIVEYDPEYVYVVVRALTADKPNSNGDCFPHDELIRLDAVLHRPVYASFIGKGVYINHQHTDDPRYAKGIILDSRYVQSNADDKYVELLLGVDRKKDPIFARDVERGLINKFSMGASVQFTKCSVCQNEARRKEEFCEHIAKHKMREVKAQDGSKKLAYELCFGVTYNEISAVSDPADETAQLLHRIAKNTPNVEIGDGTVDSANTSHGTVVLMNDIRTRLCRLEALIMANRRTAAPLPAAAPAPPAAGPAGTDPMAGGDPMGGDMQMESADPAAEQVAEVLKVVEDLVTKRIPAAEAVEALESITGGESVAPEAAPGEEMGMPEPGPTDMAGPTASAAFNAWLKRVSTTLKERNMATKTAEEKSPRVDNQYPYDKRQKDPKQFPNPAHDSRHESRPASDFDSDTKEYGKLTNVSAEFVPNTDRRLAGWRVGFEGEKPLYFVAGGEAWGEHLSEQWDRFASREYGAALVSAILEDGLDETMTRVHAIKAGGTTKTAKPETVLDNEKLIKAAEAKAADLATELNEDFVVRFVEGMKLALKLQDKNVFDNPIKGAAWEVLTGAGLDGKLAERIASGPVVEAHFDEAMRKALEYTEMSPEAFEEVKAQADQMAARSITAAAETEHGSDTVSEEEALAAMEETARQHLSRRAARNTGGVKGLTPGETPQRGFDDSVTRAVRAGNSTISRAPTNGEGNRPPASAYGKPRATA
jgi:hypothetical protein